MPVTVPAATPTAATPARMAARATQRSWRRSTPRARRNRTISDPAPARMATWVSRAAIQSITRRTVSAGSPRDRAIGLTTDPNGGSIGDRSSASARM